MESQAFKDLMSKINTIARFVTAIESKQQQEQPEKGWVDNYEVCTFLKISARTLQRLRVGGAVGFSRIRGKIFYRISDIQRLLQDNVIHGHLQDLIKNHRLHVEQRRNIKNIQRRFLAGVQKRKQRGETVRAVFDRQ